MSECVFRGKLLLPSAGDPYGNRIQVTADPPRSWPTDVGVPQGDGSVRFVPIEARMSVM